MGYESPETIITDSVQCIPNADLYTFGIITSNVHMASLKDHKNLRDYCLGKVLWHPKFHVLFLRFSVSAVLLAPAMENCYIRFLQNIYSHSLIYHTLLSSMPTELRRAHIANDKAVMAAYGFGTKMTEAECVAELMKLYQRMVKEN